MGDGWYHCRACRRKFTVRVGTLYERSHVPLHKWLLAAQVMATENPRAVTAERLGSVLSVSYRTAWRMTRRLRAAVDAVNASADHGETEPGPGERASPSPSASGRGETPDAGV
jgi:transposase-like protein